MYFAKFVWMNKITDPNITYALPHKYLGIFGMLWITFLLTSMLTAVKTFDIIGLTFSASVLAYPFTYIFSDIFTEVYGYRVSRKIVWTGFLCILISSGLAYLYAVIPPSSSYADNEAFNLIFKASPFLAITSIIAFWAGELINSTILAKLKVYFSGASQEFRYIASTFFGQIADNGIFYTGLALVVGWFNLGGGFEIIKFVMSAVLFCTLWEMLAIPITRKVIRIIKEHEGIDTYDKGTDFNPFKLH